ncbi:unnamed protein product [Camellia sinensis]
MILWSWHSSDDPTQEDYTYSLDSHGFPQYFLRKDTVKVFRSGLWNGVRFSGMPTISSNPIYNFTFVSNQNETYFNYDLLNSSVVTRMVMNQDGVLRRMKWIEGSSTSWVEHLTTEMTNCNTFAFCGPYGLCTVNNSPECSCLQRFEPKFPKDWVPDTENSRFNVSMTLKECETMFLKNSSCMAYANSDVSGEGSGRLLWFDELVDIRVIENGQDLYQNESGWPQLERGKDDHSHLSSLNSNTYYWPWHFIVHFEEEGLDIERRTIDHPEQGYYKESQNEDIELPLFHLVTITKATDYFAINNKLGEGGFGPVYKGMLEGGHEIAVKLLLKDSKQGVDEFKNEVICIARLQHRNLVKLLGYCIQGDKRILIYEFMPNNNLDSFIFAAYMCLTLRPCGLRPVLPGFGVPHKCFHIINGIARGLLYLYQDSRLRIIHRDLKGSNILLDHEMNPKISDFGLARIFGANETQANMRRVVGT